MSASTSFTIPLEKGEWDGFMVPDIAKKHRHGYYRPFRPGKVDSSFTIKPISVSDQIFEREKNSFAKLKEALLNDPQYLNRYVAVVRGKVVDSDYDDGVLAERVYKRFGYIPLFIGKITRKKRVVELPSPERT